MLCNSHVLLLANLCVMILSMVLSSAIQRLVICYFFSLPFSFLCISWIWVKISTQNFRLEIFQVLYYLFSYKKIFEIVFSSGILRRMKVHTNYAIVTQWYCLRLYSLVTDLMFTRKIVCIIINYQKNTFTLYYCVAFI